ncbi:MAG: AIM24 family protein [Lachnospiraceae bacterium]|nr:AIM24 family protein [Lachnospiraceae bacterium]
MKLKELHFQKKVGAGFFGGEGLFNTVVTGPGRVMLQTMPLNQMASSLSAYIVSGK